MKLAKSSDADWKEYYERKYKEAENQLEMLVSYLPLLINLGMEGDTEKLLMATRMIEHQLKYPRDKQILAEVISKYESKRKLTIINT